MKKTLEEEKNTFLRILNEKIDTKPAAGTILRDAINHFIDVSPNKDNLNGLYNIINRIVEECIYDRKLAEPDNYFNPKKPKSYK
jgi:hypothetical protein